MTPLSYVHEYCGRRSGFRPALLSGLFPSSVVVGVSNADDAFAYHVCPAASGTAVSGEPCDQGALVDGILRLTAGSPLVVATCDAGLHPWQASFREALLARRPDAVRVDTGLPEGGDLCSFGRGRVNLRAVAEVLGAPL